MYADQSTVTGLCMNRVSNLSLQEIQAVAAIVEPEIDSRIGSVYYWPNNEAGVPITVIPVLVKTISNYLVAGLIEKKSYAQNEAGQMTPNPYGVALEKRGDKLLQDVIAGLIIVPGLQRYNQVSGSNPPDQFRHVHGLRADQRPKRPWQ